jgi:hypothetical protein
MKHHTSPREWWEFPPDVYLDHRHRNWVLAEEAGDARFVAGAGVVLVHRERARHIADALGAGPDVARLEHLVAPRATAPREPPPRSAPPAGAAVREAAPPGIVGRATRRGRGIVGGLGIVAGAAVFVTALALPLDDPALVVALMLAVRGGRLILAVEPPPVAPAAGARPLVTRRPSLPRERRG